MVRRSQQGTGRMVMVILVMLLLLALITVTTARPPMRENGIKSEDFSIPKHPELQNLSSGCTVSAEARGAQLKVQSWPLIENRSIARSTNKNERSSPLGGSGIALGSGYLNLSGNFSTLWHQSMTANATNAEVIFDVDGDDNPDIMVVTTTYDPGTDVETKKLIIKKGTNGTHLWEEAVSAKGHGNCSIWLDRFVDLDGDNLDDAFVLETKRNSSTDVEEKNLRAKRGYDGTHLWNQTVNGTDCGIAAEWVLNLDEDALDEVIVYERSYAASTDLETKKVIAKKGNTGTHLWNQTVTANGYWNCSIGVEWIADLDGDDLDDVIVQIRKYNASDDTESITMRVTRGKDGTILWEQALCDTEVFMELHSVGDLDNDDVDDILVEEWTYNESTDLSTGHIRAKKGLDGTQLWNQSVIASGYDNCAIWFDGIANLDGDTVTDVFISEYNYNESTNISTSKVVAKNGLNGSHIWEQSVQAMGRSTCIKFVRSITDLNGDDMDDVIVFEQFVNESTNSESSKMIAKRGFDGTHLWEQSVNGTESDIWTDLVDDLDGDNCTDVIVLEWSYNESTDTESNQVIATRGFDGTHLWEQSMNGTESYILTDLVDDLDGDNRTDVIIHEWSYNESMDLRTRKILAKKGINGIHLWEQSVNGTECSAGIQFRSDLDGDGLDDVLVYEWAYTESLDLDTTNLIAKKGNNGTNLWEQSLTASGYGNTDIWPTWPDDLDGDGLDDVVVLEYVYNISTDVATVKVIAKKGTNGTHLWEQSVQESGEWSCDIWVDTFADLDGDDLDDAVIIEWANNELTQATLERLIAKRGYDGMHLFEAVSNEPIWTAWWWDEYDLNGDGQNDLVLGIPTAMYAVTYHIATPNLFDTDTSVYPYPSIAGRHNGTITPLNDIVLHTLYTYACQGTGGHSEYVRIWGNGVDVNATWTGYVGNWDTISFNEPFVTLEANKTYNYTIVTGSYPQIIHAKEFNATGGRITCTRFESANGRVFEQGIPAIRIE